MAGETLHATIIAVFGGVVTLSAAWIAARPNLLTAKIALKQLEIKEKQDAYDREHGDEKTDELEELRAEIEDLREEIARKDKGRKR